MIIQIVMRHGAYLSCRASKYDACTSTEVLEEILCRYSSIGQLDTARDVYDHFGEICPVVFSVTLADTNRVRDLLGATARLSARDAAHAAVMLNNDVDGWRPSTLASTECPGFAVCA